MSLKNIFWKIYCENRRLIIGYMCFALVFSVLMFGTSISNATADTKLIFMGGEFSSSLNMFLMVLFPTIDPSIGMGISAILAILGEYDLLPAAFGNPDFGLLSISWAFRIAIFIWVTISILPRYFGVTNIFGIALESLNDKYAGALILFMNIVPGIFKIGNNASVSAANVNAVLNNSGNTFSSGAMYVWNAAFAFATMMAIFICYFFMRYFLLFIDIILIPATSTIPFVACIFQSMKVGICALMAYWACVHKGVFLIIYVVLLVVSIFFFKKAYITVRYFKQIYLLPMLHRIFGTKKVFSIVETKLPRKMEGALAGRNCKVVMPIFPLRKLQIFKPLKKYDLWWLIVDENDKVSVGKVIKGKLQELKIVSTSQNRIFMKKSLFYIEIFSAPGEKNIGKRFRRIRKELHMVVSKDYVGLYEELLKATQFTDYK